MHVHTGVKALLCVLMEGVRRHGDDRHGFRIRAVGCADFSGGGQTIHHRHHNVHQNRVERADRTFAEPVDRLLSVADDSHFRAFVGQQRLHDFGVQCVVLSQQQAQTAHAFGLDRRRNRLFFWCRRNFKRNIDHKRGADTEFAGDRNRAAHLIEQALDDGHAETRAVIITAGIAVFLRKRLENVLKEILAHADAGVRNSPAVGAFAVLLVQCLHDRGDRAARTVVLDAVAVNVQENLPQVQRTAVNVRIGNNGLALFVIPAQTVFDRTIDHNIDDIARQIHQTDAFVCENDRAVLQLAHLQHIVNERQQVIGGNAHFLVVGADEFGVLEVSLVDVD